MFWDFFNEIAEPVPSIFTKIASLLHSSQQQNKYITIQEAFCWRITKPNGILHVFLNTYRSSLVNYLFFLLFQKIYSR